MDERSGRADDPDDQELALAEAGDATVKRFHYASHDQFRQHLADFVATCNFARRLKTLRGVTSYEAICKAWKDEPSRFTQSVPSNSGTKHLSVRLGLVISKQDIGWAPCRSNAFPTDNHPRTNIEMDVSKMDVRTRYSTRAIRHHGGY